MNKLSTKLRQKQSIVPQQIIKSRLLELSIDELEKDLENEIQVNPVIEEKSIEESRSNNQVDSFQDQSSYELFLANIPESRDITDDLIIQIDTSNLGSQPMSVDGRYWIIYNGEIYNYKTLREELILKKYKFYSNSDTEVVLNAYKEWGVDSFKKFNGEWSFAILDKKHN